MNIKYVLSVDLHLFRKCMYRANLWKGAKQERERSNHSLLNELGPHCLEIVIHSLISLSGFRQINSRCCHKHFFLERVQNAKALHPTQAVWYHSISVRPRHLLN